MTIGFPLDSKNLVIGYKGKTDKTVAGPLNFNLSKGSLVGLIGTNGIGKLLLRFVVNEVFHGLSKNDELLNNVTPANPIDL